MILLRRMGQMLLIGLGVLLVLIVLLWFWFFYGEDLAYRWVDLPAVRAEAGKLPGVTVRGLRTFNSPGDPANIHVIFRIAGKGDFALMEPTRASFTGGGPLRLDGIGTCGRTPVLHLPFQPVFADLQLRTVADVIAHYDTIEQRVRGQEGWCLEGVSLEPQEP